MGGGIDESCKNYDVIIIGAGPAGIFTALELADKGYRILMVEKGQDIRERIATSRNPQALAKDKVRNVVCGWGGAGAFSDGKLTLTTEFGGNLDDYMSQAELAEKSAMSIQCTAGSAGPTARCTVMKILKKSAASSAGQLRPTCASSRPGSVILEQTSTPRS